MAKRVSEHLLEEIFKSERVSEYSSIRCYPLFVYCYFSHLTTILVNQEPSRF